MSQDFPYQDDSVQEDTSECDYQKVSSHDSYVFARNQAEEIKSSMDISMEFWGNVRDTSLMVPAYRLKRIIEKPNRASEVAKATWARMDPGDIETLKIIQGILMKNGEIEIEKLFEVLERTSQRVGMSFQEMFPECYNDDLISSAVDVMNELLYILNANEPPEIDEEEVYFPAFNHTGSMFISIKQDEKTRRKKMPLEDEGVIESKIKRLLVKAQKLGIDNINVPSSLQLSELSKLQVIEKQVKAKIRLQRLNAKILNNNLANPEIPSKPESPTIHNIRREINMKYRADNMKYKPAFKAVVKPRSFDIDATFKNAPNLQKRMKRTKRKLLEAQLNSNNISRPHSENGREGFMTMSHLFNYIERNNNKLPERYIEKNTEWNISKKSGVNSASPGPNILKSSQTQLKLINRRKILRQLRSKIRKNIYNFESGNTSKCNGSTKEKDSVVPGSENVPHQNQNWNNREEMLTEMKKMLKEAIKTVGSQQNPVMQKSLRSDTHPNSEDKDQPTNCFLTAYCQTSQQDVTFDKDIDKTNPMELNNERKPDQEMKVDIQRLVNDEEDTLDIKVTQESMSPLLWPLAREQERTVTTEISVSKLNPGPSVRLLVVNKVKSEEEGLCKLAIEQPERVQEAVSYLNELLDSNSSQRQALELPEEDILLDKDNKQKSLPASNMDFTIETTNENEPPQTVDMVKNISDPLDTESTAEILTIDSAKDLDGLIEEEENVSKDSLQSEAGDYDGDLPTVNVNMAFLMEDFRYGFVRDDPRACTLFQMMVGQEPPRILEEIGDVGSALRIGGDPWTWQENLIDPPTTDSMDSLYVNTGQSQNIIMEDLYSDHPNYLTILSINKEEFPQCVSTEEEPPNETEEERRSLEITCMEQIETFGELTSVSTTDVERKEESQYTVANPTVYLQGADNQITTDSLHPPDQQIIIENSQVSDMPVAIVNLRPPVTSRSVWHLVRTFFTKIYFSPFTNPYYMMKRIWSRIFHTTWSARGEITGSSAPLESPD